MKLYLRRWFEVKLCGGELRASYYASIEGNELGYIPLNKITGSKSKQHQDALSLFSLFSLFSLLSLLSLPSLITSLLFLTSSLTCHFSSLCLSSFSLPVHSSPLPEIKASEENDVDFTISVPGRIYYLRATDDNQKKSWMAGLDMFVNFFL